MNSEPIPESWQVYLFHTETDRYVLQTAQIASKSLARIIASENFKPDPVPDPDPVPESRTQVFITARGSYILELVRQPNKYVSNIT